MSWELAALLTCVVLLCLAASFGGGLLAYEVGRRIPRGKSQLIAGGPKLPGHRHVWQKRSEEETNRQRVGVYVCAGCADRERRIEEELG